jgi:hypothetical protein
MNDYSIGAIEALSWAKAIIKKCSTLEEIRAARAQVEEMILKLVGGTALSFRDRAELIKEL